MGNLEDISLYDVLKFKKRIIIILTHAFNCTVEIKDYDFNGEVLSVYFNDYNYQYNHKLDFITYSKATKYNAWDKLEKEIYLNISEVVFKLVKENNKKIE